MRYPKPSSIPGRPATAIQPIAKPGKYQARLTVDGVSQTREFELFMNPNEPYTQEQTDERFAFWMELYNNVEASSQNVLAALKIKEDVNVRVEAMKEAGVKIDATAVDCLKHVILAHHGQYDFGSPKLPATAEAFMVSRFFFLI